MQKDFKIGLLLGSIFVVGVAIWLCTHPRLSPEARMHEPQDNISHQQSPIAPALKKAPTETPNSRLSTFSNQSRQIDYTVYEQPEKIETQKFHIVQRGETLSAISQKYYGSAGKWQKIFDANRQTIQDVNKIQPGTKLIIPD